MPIPLDSNLDTIANRIRSCGRLLLLSDFDGTLVPIHEHPALCFLDPAVGATLSSLVSCERLSVGVVSGRQIQDLKSRVGIEGLTYVGNHGLECEGPDVSFRESTDAHSNKALRDSIYEVAASVGPFPGAWVEDKGLTASVHYRQVDPVLVPALLADVRRVVARDVEERRIVLRHGKMVLEVRPAVPWNKGTAVRRLIDRRRLQNSDPLLIYLGDDETDEDVFRDFRDDITVCVGDRPGTAAKYSIHDTRAVHAFFAWVSQVVIASECRSDSPTIPNAADAAGSR